MQLAQLNIATAKAPMSDPSMDGFTGNIDRINALADRSAGFVWRMVDDTSDTDGALDLRLPGDDDILVNMSVWTDIESLFHFVYKTAHTKVMQGKAAWFDPMPREHMVLWWVEDGHIPTLDEAKARLDHLREHGSSPTAFGFASPFDAKGQPVSPPFPKKDCA